MNGTIGFVTSGSIGVRISVSAGGFYLTGSTCTLLAAPGDWTAPQTNYGPALDLMPLTVSADGLSAYYTTTGTDFEAAGPCTLWLKVVTSSQDLISEPLLVYVFPAPALSAA